jgi:hypothetical protein
MTHFMHLFVQHIHAVDWGNTLKGPNSDVATIQSLVPLLSNIIAAISGFVGVVLFVMLVMGGFNFLLSGGDPKQLEKAKGTITSALIGLVVIICSYLILRTIETFTGLSILTIVVPEN